MALAGRAGGWLAEAMRNLGKKHITTQRLRAFRDAIGPKERRELLADVRYVPNWMRPYFLELTRNEPTKSVAATATTTVAQ
jgi:hypothetical protein